MKKSLSSIVASALIVAGAGLALAGPASATNLNLGYRYLNVHGNKPVDHTQYGYIGLAQATPYGVFDLGLQGTGITPSTGSTDRAAGWEAGYSYPIDVNRFRITPRLGYGAMNQLNSGNARYYSVMLEATTPVRQNVGVFVNYTHLNGTNKAAAPATNRVQAGLDYSLSQRVALRAGVAHEASQGTKATGVIVAASYAF